MGSTQSHSRSRNCHGGIIPTQIRWCRITAFQFFSFCQLAGLLVALENERQSNAVTLSDATHHEFAVRFFVGAFVSKLAHARILGRETLGNFPAFSGAVFR